jgi:putative NIF3 family GTP cyclohydrolase 1 type 2
MKTKYYLLIIIILFLSVGKIDGQKSRPVTASALIDEIIKKTGSEIVPNTVDVIKAGDPETPVTGIVTCMFATMDVLRKAAALRCNLVITHEPVFYNHRDVTEQFKNDSVFLEKKRFIDDHKLVIWRFHDYIHRMQPDGIDYGMVRKLGWQKYLVDGTSNQIIVPEKSLREIVIYLKRIFPGNTLNVIGNPEMKLTNIRFSAGAPGSSVHIALLENEDVDLVIGGEVPQWETYEYVRDAVIQGRRKAIIFLGHIPSEEAGMEYGAEWLRTFIKDLPVNFISCGPSYRTY